MYLSLVKRCTLRTDVWNSSTPQQHYSREEAFFFECTETPTARGRSAHSANKIPRNSSRSVALDARNPGVPLTFPPPTNSHPRDFTRLRAVHDRHPSCFLRILGGVRSRSKQPARLSLLEPHPEAMHQRSGSCSEAWCTLALCFTPGSMGQCLGGPGGNPG